MVEHRLLSENEEVDLAMQLEAGRDAQSRMDAGDDDPQLPALAESGCEARDLLILHNQRLVYKICRKYATNDIAYSHEDLIQEGMIGLMTAVDRYDWRLGNRFSTYATWWIRQAISRKRREAGTIRLPYERTDNPSYAMARERASAVLELDGPIGSDAEGIVLMDVLPGPDDTEDEALTNVQVEQLLGMLSPQYVPVIRDWMNGATVEEAGANHGLSRSMVWVATQQMRKGVAQIEWKVRRHEKEG